MVKIVGIVGSLRPDSYSALALKQAVERVEKLGAAVEILDLREMNLPFCDGGNEYPEYPDVEILRAKVKTANGLILATPEYHGSLSGVLKNALDLMSFEHLSDKVTGLISVLGGQSNSNALNDLRLILRWVHGVPIPLQRTTSPIVGRLTALLRKRVLSFTLGGYLLLSPRFLVKQSRR